MLLYSIISTFLSCSICPLLQLRYLTIVYRGFHFSPLLCLFSPGAVGVLLFPAALHASQKNTNLEPAFGLMAMLKNVPLWSMKDNAKHQSSPERQGGKAADFLKIRNPISRRAMTWHTLHEQTPPAQQLAVRQALRLAITLLSCTPHLYGGDQRLKLTVKSSWSLCWLHQEQVQFPSVPDELLHEQGWVFHVVCVRATYLTSQKSLLPYSVQSNKLLQDYFSDIQFCFTTLKLNGWPMSRLMCLYCSYN